MNPNGTHDKALLEEIERLLNQRKQKQLDGIDTMKSTHPVLDELTSLIPQASPEFEDALETRLLARFQPKIPNPVTTNDLNDLEAHIPMTSDNYLRTYQPDTAHTQHHRRSRRLPLTLAAAVIAVLFSVALLLTLSALPEDDEPPIYSALLTATSASSNVLNADDCPPVDGWTDTYTVRSGDTFSFIAARYGIDFDHLYQMYEANCIPEDPNYVPNVGDVLRIPDVINPTPTVIFTITPTIASAQLEATRILTEATQRALDGTLTFTPTPIPDSMQLEATRIIADSTQRSATPSSGQLDATRILAESTQQTAMNACNTEATQAAQCSESGIAQTVEAAVQATLSAMGQPTSGGNVTVITATATITPSITFTPTPTWTITASATFTPTMTPTLTNTPTPAGETVTQIVVARRNIRRGEVITENDITEGMMLTSQVVEYAVESIDDVVGMTARTDIYIGQTIESWALVDDPNDLLDGVVVPEGRNSILIPFDTILNVSYGVQQGDHVSLEVVQDGSTVATFEDVIALGLLTNPDRLIVAVLPTDATAYFDLIDSGAEFQISITLVNEESSGETTQIVVAVQVIGRGQIITENNVALRDLPINAVPENAITAIEDVVGMRARTDIYIEQPILTTMVLQDFTIGDIDVPDGKRVFAMPLDTNSVSLGVQEGDFVSIGIVPNDPTYAMVENILVLAVNEDIAYVAVSPEEAEALGSLAMDLYIYLIPVTETVEVAVPMPALLMDAPLEVGSRVDVLVALRYINVDEEFQSIEPGILVVGQDKGLYNVWQLPLGDLQATSEDFTLSEGSDLSPNITIQRIVINAFVVHIGEFPTTADLQPDDTELPPIVTLAVSPDDAIILNYLIDAQVPLAFVRAGG